MRILVVSNLFPPGYIGGYELGCSQVCELLVEQGHHVEVLTSDYEEGDPNDYPNPNLPVHRMLRLYVPFGKPATLMRRRRREVGRHNQIITDKAIRRVEPDVVYIWSQLRLTVGAARAAVAHKLPVAYRFGDAHVLGYMPAAFGWSPRQIYRYVADNWIFRDVTLRDIPIDNVSCISQRLKKQLLDSGLAIDNCQVTYNGIPIELFPVKQDRGGVHSPARILYVGQLHHYKGVHTVIEAAHRLCRATGMRCQLGIAGSGPEDYRQELQSLANDGPALVNFYGKVPYHKLKDVYHEHDIFVFSSIWEEPQGVTYLEAMASGTPVVSTVDGGHGEIIRDGENALAFAKENPEELATRLQLLIDKDELRHRIVDNAVKEVTQRFTLQEFAKKELLNLEQAVGAVVK